ncbi:hypothetical protein HGG82_15345 [Marinomonas sp. M1K-6]|uniref:Oligosaccharide repeat unit polymerase n=1 Tax=Marinomonas profundi TaxID=2726122 RepID=A0A847R4Q2_9GAMM|nr:hypothetical protein [Marinomonas profundi]NLQ18982.1 hypothetical protein [Marinomonas profundi]UDV04186.1 hypothetical protein J8N69_05385 [Marinomonas profundi]
MVLINALGLSFIFIYTFIFLYSFCVDITTGALANKLTNSFTVRALTIFIMSVVPSAFFVCYYLKGDDDKLKKLILSVFLLQTFFWFFTFYYPGGKELIYSIMGMSNSVNIIYEWNYYTRGFGYTPEINFTAPFVMVLTVLTLFRVKVFNFFIVFTQLFNSNNVVVALILGFLTRFKSRYFFRFLFLSFWFFIILVFIYLYYVDYLPQRLQEELSSGGMRTINIIFEDHFIFTNADFLEFILGNGNYMFLPGLNSTVDPGWIILINYGGVFYTTLFLFFIVILCFRAFGNKAFFFVWVFAGFWLNFKGLIFSPNAYLFILFMFAMNRAYKKHIVNDINI